MRKQFDLIRDRCGPGGFDRRPRVQCRWVGRGHHRFEAFRGTCALPGCDTNKVLVGCS